MDLNIVSLGKANAGTISVSDQIFGQEYNTTLVHQVVVAYQAGARQGTKAQKTRSEVRGGGAKPWRQKGMGKARAGTIRSPIWVGGGRAFAAKPRDFTQKVNKKMYKAAIRSMFSKLAQDDRLMIVKDFELAEPKTKLLLEQLNALNVESCLIICDGISENLYYASRNIPNVLVVDTQMLDPVALLKHKKVIMLEGAVRMLEEKLL